MNTGQMMLMTFAFAMLSTLALTVNGTITNVLTIGLESELAMNAHAMAQSLMDEILTRNFDERSIRRTIYNPSDFTGPGSFGTDLGEAMPGGIAQVDTSDGTGTYHSQRRFDDVDDYHRYQRRMRNPLGWEFLLQVGIVYADENVPDTSLTVQSYIKRILVSVTHPNLPRDEAGNLVPVTMTDLAVYRRFF